MKGATLLLGPANCDPIHTEWYARLTTAELRIRLLIGQVEELQDASSDNDAPERLAWQEKLPDPPKLNQPPIEFEAVAECARVSVCCCNNQICVDTDIIRSLASLNLSNPTSGDKKSCLRKPFLKP